jgi:hypothetical protein
MFIAFSLNVTVLVIIMSYFIVRKLLWKSGCCIKRQCYRKMKNGENLIESLNKDRNNSVYDFSENDSDGS